MALKEISAMSTYNGRIIQDPDILVGKPVIRGTRISVELVLGKLSEDLDVGHLLDSYPHITQEDVMACLDYARRRVKRTRRAKHAGSTAEAVTAAAW